MHRGAWQATVHGEQRVGQDQSDCVSGRVLSTLSVSIYKDSQSPIIVCNFAEDTKALREDTFDSQNVGLGSELI